MHYPANRRRSRRLPAADHERVDGASGARQPVGPTSRENTSLVAASRDGNISLLSKACTTPRHQPQANHATISGGNISLLAKACTTPRHQPQANHATISGVVHNQWSAGVTVEGETVKEVSGEGELMVPSVLKQRLPEALGASGQPGIQENN